MRPEEMGFVVPCERCGGPLWEAFVEICRSYYYGEVDSLYDLSSALEAHGRLDYVSGSDAVLCRICGARWVLCDVEPQFPRFISGRSQGTVNISRTRDLWLERNTMSATTGNLDKKVAENCPLHSALSQSLS